MVRGCKICWLLSKVWRLMERLLQWNCLNRFPKWLSSAEIIYYKNVFMHLTLIDVSRLNCVLTSFGHGLSHVKITHDRVSPKHNFDAFPQLVVIHVYSRSHGHGHDANGATFSGCETSSLLKCFHLFDVCEVHHLSQIDIKKVKNKKWCLFLAHWNSSLFNCDGQ